jgi:TP901-1 family phage major tail protein
MAIKNATEIKIYIGGTKVADCTSTSFTRNHSVRDASSKDSGGYQESLEGMRDWSASAEGFIDLESAYGFNDLAAIWRDRSQVSVRISTNTSGEEYEQGMAYLTSLEKSGGVEESATFSVEFQGTGELTYIALT